MKGWFIVKENEKYTLRKGFIVDTNTLELGSKRYRSYFRLGDAKVGLENYNKNYVNTIKTQENLFKELQKTQVKNKETVSLDYEELNRQAELLKQKWGIK